jgi:hypothetical protein
MKRLALLIACLAASAANTCLAAEPEACMAACASEQQQCKGPQPKDDRLMHAGPQQSRADKRVAGGLRGYDQRATDEDAASFRRLARGSACEAGYQQCTRDCCKAQGAGACEAAKDAGQAGQTG